MRILPQFHKVVAKDSYYTFSRRFSNFKKSISWFRSRSDFITNEAMRGDSLSYYWSGDNVDYCTSNYLHEYTYMAYRGSGLSELPAKFKRYRKSKRRRYAT